MIKIINLYKNFGKLKVLKKINLEIEDGKFTLILGPNGCGKTTLLRIIAGLENPTKGKVLVDKKIGFIFQEPILFPWRSVKKNIEFGLEIKNVKNRKEIIDRYIELLKLKEFERYYPNELSAGMKQKVSIARTLVTDPSILLMDEPFSMLDALTRKKMQKELIKIWYKNKKTIIFVTHDIEEAIFLADKIFLLSNRPAELMKKFEIKIERNKREYNKKLYKIKENIQRLLSIDESVK